MNPTVIEIIGYVGSGLVLVSFLMASVVKLRVVNTIGSFIFAVYALLIPSYPTALMNVCLVLINLYHLYKLRNSEPNYRLLPLDPGDVFPPDRGGGERRSGDRSAWRGQRDSLCASGGDARPLHGRDGRGGRQ